MIRGVVTYRFPYTTLGGDRDYLAEEFYRTRACMIERIASLYPALKTSNYSSGDHHHLDVRSEGKSSQRAQRVIGDFLLEIEDRNLGTIEWRVDAPEE